MPVEGEEIYEQAEYVCMEENNAQSKRNINKYKTKGVIIGVNNIQLMNCINMK